MLRAQLDAEKEVEGSTPVIVNPNAGLPRSEGSRTVYDINSDQFARKMREIAEMGVFMMGGCCGTDHRHVERIAETCSVLFAR